MQMLSANGHKTSRENESRLVIQPGCQPGTISIYSHISIRPNEWINLDLTFCVVVSCCSEENRKYLVIFRTAVQYTAHLSGQKRVLSLMMENVTPILPLYHILHTCFSVDFTHKACWRTAFFSSGTQLWSKGLETECRSTHRQETTTAAVQRTAWENEGSQITIHF